MTWKPSDQSHPVIWLSEDAKIAPGKSIRGGVPVCWPWFGPHGVESKFPAHGFARAVPWELLEALEKNGIILMKFRLISSDSFKNQWPHPSTLELSFEIGSTLKVELTTTNTGSNEFSIGEALHTYFQIGDIEKISVEGLDKTEYLDKVGIPAKRIQSGAINFSSEVDRVFMNTKSECSLIDGVLGRKIKIQKSDSMSTIVWTPWKEKAEQMGDMGKNEGWKRMVCVETGNALNNCVTVKAGSKHTLTAIYSAEKL
jgi:D-hexose-6-phosphate mutarotase